MPENEIAQAVAGCAGVLDTASAIADQAQSLVIGEGGKLVVNGLAQWGFARLRRRYKEYRRQKKISDAFESSEHGQALLQDALNALYKGLDKERAEAVSSVFLGLATTPVEDALERVQQLEIMKIACSLTTWEVFLVNSIERFSKQVYRHEYAARFARSKDTAEDGQLRELIKRNEPEFDPWLKAHCGGDSAAFVCLRDAWKNLYERKVLHGVATNNSDCTHRCACRRRGPFTDFGWKLVVHLYTATDAT